jgi:hypothetical protein
MRTTLTILHITPPIIGVILFNTWRYRVFLVLCPSHPEEKLNLYHTYIHACRQNNPLWTLDDGDFLGINVGLPRNKQDVIIFAVGIWERPQTPERIGVNIVDEYGLVARSASTHPFQKTRHLLAAAFAYSDNILVTLNNFS